MPSRRASQLEALEKRLPSIVEFDSRAPDHPPPWDYDRILHFRGTGKCWVIDYPLAYQWLKCDRESEQKRLKHLISKTWGSEP